MLGEKGGDSNFLFKTLMSTHVYQENLAIERQQKGHGNPPLYVLDCYYCCLPPSISSERTEEVCPSAGVRVFYRVAVGKPVLLVHVW